MIHVKLIHQCIAPSKTTGPASLGALHHIIDVQTGKTLKNIFFPLPHPINQSSLVVTNSYICTICKFCYFCVHQLFQELLNILGNVAPNTETYRCILLIRKKLFNFLSLSIWRPKRNVYIIWKPRYQK